MIIEIKKVENVEQLEKSLPDGEYFKKFKWDTEMYSIKNGKFESWRPASEEGYTIVTIGKGIEKDIFVLIGETEVFSDYGQSFGDAEPHEYSVEFTPRNDGVLRERFRDGKRVSEKVFTEKFDIYEMLKKSAYMRSVY